MANRCACESFPKKWDLARGHGARFGRKAGAQLVSLADTTIGVLGSPLEGLHRLRGKRSYGSRVKPSGGSSRKGRTAGSKRIGRLGGRIGRARKRP